LQPCYNSSTSEKYALPIKSFYYTTAEHILKNIAHVYIDRLENVFKNPGDENAGLYFILQDF